MNALETKNANVHRTAAIGGANRGNIDLNDPQVVELYRRDLSDRDRHSGVGASVK